VAPVYSATMEQSSGADTRSERPEGSERFDSLYAEAKTTLGYAANQLRAITERYRGEHRAMLLTWHRERDELERIEQRAIDAGRTRATAVSDAAGPADAETGGGSASAAEVDAEGSLRREIRHSVDLLGAELGEHQRELSRLELVTKNLENVWLFVERGDASLVSDETTPLTRADLRMRIIEAQEGERSRLAQEIHDGPAQSITNAFFQVDYVERLMDRDVRLARTELRYLREILRRELADIRSFISQLRPPALDELGMDGAILDTVATFSTLIAAPIHSDLTARGDVLGEMEQTVVLRVLQEALQNVRKHADAHVIDVTTRDVLTGWVLEVKDDGRGFDIDAVAARGRRNFGLRFMRERVELIGGRLDIRSSPGAGTVVRVEIGREVEAP
jgi:two-component system sensor histidine kinase DegS